MTSYESESAALASALAIRPSIQLSVWLQCARANQLATNQLIFSLSLHHLSSDPSINRIDQWSRDVKSRGHGGRVLDRKLLLDLTKNYTKAFDILYRSLLLLSSPLLLTTPVQWLIVVFTVWASSSSAAAALQYVIHYLELFIYIYSFVAQQTPDHRLWFSSRNNKILMADSNLEISKYVVRWNTLNHRQVKFLDRRIRNRNLPSTCAKH